MWPRRQRLPHATSLPPRPLAGPPPRGGVSGAALGGAGGGGAGASGRAGPAGQSSPRGTARERGSWTQVASRAGPLRDRWGLQGAPPFRSDAPQAARPPAQGQGRARWRRAKTRELAPVPWDSGTPACGAPPASWGLQSPSGSRFGGAPRPPVRLGLGGSEVSGKWPFLQHQVAFLQHPGNTGPSKAVVVGSRTERRRHPLVALLGLNPPSHPRGVERTVGSLGSLRSIPG